MFQPKMYLEDAYLRSRAMSWKAYQAYFFRLYQQETKFLDQILTKKETSFTFQQWMATELLFQYANRLSEYFFQHPFEQEAYHEFVSQYNLNDSRLLVSNQFALFLDNHLRHLCQMEDYQIQSQHSLTGLAWQLCAYSKAEEIFQNPDVKEYMMAKILMQLIHQSFGGVADIYDDFMQRTVVNENLKNKISTVFQNSHSFYLTKQENKNLQLQIITPPKDSTTIDNAFLDIIHRFKGKKVYAGFWASWCKPCLEQMAYSKQLKTQAFPDNNKWVILYFSTDKNAGAWKAQLNKLNMSGHHYLLNETLAQSIMQQFQIWSLPRYMMFDEKGNLLDKNAPKPKDLLYTNKLAWP